MPHQRLQGREICCRVAGGQSRQPAPRSRPRRARTGPVPGGPTATSGPKADFSVSAQGSGRGDGVVRRLLRNDGSARGRGVVGFRLSAPWQPILNGWGASHGANGVNGVRSCRSRRGGVIPPGKSIDASGGWCHSEGGARSILSGCTKARAPTEESAGWAHHRVGYDWLWREEPRPFPKEILRSAHGLPGVPASPGWAPSSE